MEQFFINQMINKLQIAIAKAKQNLSKDSVEDVASILSLECRDVHERIDIQLTIDSSKEIEDDGQPTTGN